MSLTLKTFEVAVDNERAALAFDTRATVVDFLRGRIKDALARAEDAEIDRQTALRRFSLNWAATAKGYRLPRAIPASLVSWAAFVVYHHGREGYPTPSQGTVGTFDRESVTSLPGDVLLVKMGGITFAGTLAGGRPADLFEVRVSRTDEGKYVASFVCGRFNDGSGAGMDVPVEPDTVDA